MIQRESGKEQNGGALFTLSHERATDAEPIVVMTEGRMMNTEIVHFRASPVLAAAIYSRAREAGCSVSEYLRSIARDRVGL